nr:MAG TPA: hypothetical protein [Caudoviricetes sp.]DAP95983.1 MAG TPA: hypothetical protein [Caudoviricetes sp.]
MAQSRGKIIFCFRRFTSYALRVTIFLNIAFHSD